ncbi:MAG: hypothetical protein AAFX52_13730 [Pseudomonadota bacterium]
MRLGLGLTVSVNSQSVASQSSPLVPATSGMALDGTWSSVGQSQTTLASATMASVKISVQLSSTDFGIIIEQGGPSRGLIIYVHNGTLYFQCGGGITIGPGPDRAFIEHAISGPIQLIEFSASSIHDKAALYVDGVLVGTDTFDDAAIAGTGPGGLGQCYVKVPENYGGWTTDGSGVFSGTINNAEIYLDEVTSDVLS